MLAGHVLQSRQISLVEAPEPKLKGDGQIIFEPQLGCLCGSDLLQFEGDYLEYPPGVGQPLHEMIGRVADSSSRRFLKGDRVLCVPVDHRGLWQRWLASDKQAVPLDARLSGEQAVLSQPLGTVICALRKLPSLIGRDIAVVGQGPIGLLFSAALRNLGAREIIAVDLLDQRLEVAARMGATVTINPQREDAAEAVRRSTGGQLADLVIEAVGHREQALNTCIELCRPHGNILFFGVPTETIDGVRWKELFGKNIAIHTSVGPDFSIDFPLAMRWIAEGRLDVSPLVTHRFPLADIQQAFDVFSQRRDGALKVFVDFPESP